MVVRFSEQTEPASKKEHQVQWHEFLSLESPHPYGVLPAGNRFLIDPSECHKNPNDSFFGKLGKDDIWLQILGFLDGESLACAVQTCRFWYVVGHQPELWRDLVLRRQGSKPIDRMGDSWKDTYFKLYHKLPCPSKPMKIPGIYSDDLYRLHSCRAFAIPHSWLQETLSPAKAAVPFERSENLTCDDFVEKYERPNRPVLIKGACKNWKAFREWQDPQYLRDRSRGRSYRATSGVAPLPANFTLEAFQKYCSNQNLEEGPLYLFDRRALEPGSDLHQDFYPDLQRSCPYFDPQRAFDDNDIVGHDLFQVLGEGKRPDHTWMITGGNHSGSVFHIDPNATNAWNAAIVGRKRWVFYPPGVTPPGIHPSDDGDEVALPLSIGEWILTFWKEHQEFKRRAHPAEQPLECTAFPGDVVFVPHGWWHMVINLDAPFNIAVTHNFVSRANLGNVLRFLKTKEDQISGCRDRTESIKPDKLYSAFVQALEDKFGNDAVWLEKSKHQAATRWTCRAWTDESRAEVCTKSLENASGGPLRPFRKKQRMNTMEIESEILTSAKDSVIGKAKANFGTENASFSFSFL